MKKLFISVNEIVHILPGREEKGNAIVYCGDPAFDHLEKFCANNARETFLMDLAFVDDVYFYAALSSWDFAQKAMVKLQEYGKKVTMIACSCNQRKKDQFAEKHGIKQIWSECGGHQTMSDLINRYGR